MTGNKFLSKSRSDAYRKVFLYLKKMKQIIYPENLFFINFRNFGHIAI